MLESLPKVLKTFSKEGATLYYVLFLFYILYIYIELWPFLSSQLFLSSLKYDK